MNDYQFWNSIKRNRPPLWSLALAPIFVPFAVLLALGLAIALLACVLLDWADKPGAR